jgi:hypothetical protein
MCCVGLDCEENICLTMPFLSMMYVTLPGSSPRVDGTP